MATAYTALVLGSGDDRQLEQQLGSQYVLTYVDTIEATSACIVANSYEVLIINEVALGMASSIDACRQLRTEEMAQDLPVVMLADVGDLADRMDAYEVGFDDLIGRDNMWELRARLDRVIFNKHANDQLRNQLQQANEMAFIAMSDTSDLGVNIQFLLSCNQCDNLDELGMSLFQAVQSYGLNCSLQIRSQYGIKNMEANGMAKEMESVLMMECKDSGRYVDFGKRSIMNYETVSILVKNMPVEDENKYGAIKDNVFSLLQGAHARVVALDNLKALELEGALVKRMATQMRDLITQVDDSYQEVMCDIAGVVENMADGVERSIQFLGMDENQERAIQDIMEAGIQDTNRVFSDGIKLDSGLRDFLAQVDGLFSEKHIDSMHLQRLLE
jgi:CheY-like chemotaxis protein